MNNSFNEIQQRIKIYLLKLKEKQMLDHSFFNFSPSCLVRMSKDDIIDQYNIFPIKIGEGNDAVVYKAKQNLENGQWRAVKKIHRKYIQKQEYLNTQIQILKKLDHPGILKIYEVFDDSQYVFIVTELCQGTSLLQQLRKRSYYRQPQAKTIFKKIIEIVSYCHQNKIIHRDLKLQNLVFCSKQNTLESLRLIDFGMSFQWNSHPRIQIKNTYSSNKVVGTIYYMAPEVYNETYDQRVDVWSAGVILFFLLTGELPFFQDEDDEILDAVMHRKIPYEKLKHRKCSPQAHDLLKKIFQPEHKRISIDQILAHPWLQSHQPQQKLSKQTLHYFSLIPFKQFSKLDEYYLYCRQQIFQISTNQTNDVQNLYRTLNWNNVYDFLKMDRIDKAIKVYLAYRMIYEKSHRYIKMFDHFKVDKKEIIMVETLRDHLRLEYEDLLGNLGQSLSATIAPESKHRLNRQLSLQDQHIISTKQVYKDLLKFFETHKQRSIGFTMFLSMVCDLEQFDQPFVDHMKQAMRGNVFNMSVSQTLQGQITRIHKIVRQHYIEKKKKAKSQYNRPTNISPTSVDNATKYQIRPQNLSPSHIPLHSQSAFNLQIKKPQKKTIKQNIFQSLTPTFKRKIQNKQQRKAPQTDRIKGSRLLETGKINNNVKEQGFFYGIQKIIEYW